MFESHRIGAGIPLTVPPPIPVPSLQPSGLLRSHERGVPFELLAVSDSKNAVTLWKETVDGTWEKISQ